MSHGSHGESAPLFTPNVVDSVRSSILCGPLETPVEPSYAAEASSDSGSSTDDDDVEMDGVVIYERAGVNQRIRELNGIQHGIPDVNKLEFHQWESVHPHYLEHFRANWNPNNDHSDVSRSALSEPYGGELSDEEERAVCTDIPQAVVMYTSEGFPVGVSVSVPLSESLGVLEIVEGVPASLVTPEVIDITKLLEADAWRGRDTFAALSLGAILTITTILAWVIPGLDLLGENGSTEGSRDSVSYTYTVYEETQVMSVVLSGAVGCTMHIIACVSVFALWLDRHRRCCTKKGLRCAVWCAAGCAVLAYVALGASIVRHEAWLISERNTATPSAAPSFDTAPNRNIAPYAAAISFSLLSLSFLFSVARCVIAKRGVNKIHIATLDGISASLLGLALSIYYILREGSDGVDAVFGTNQALGATGTFDASGRAVYIWGETEKLSERGFLRCAGAFIAGTAALVLACIAIVVLKWKAHSACTKKASVVLSALLLFASLLHAATAFDTHEATPAWLKNFGLTFGFTLLSVYFVFIVATKLVAPL